MGAPDELVTMEFFQDPLIGFNEAGAWEPRMRTTWISEKPTSRRFNEAGAWEPRMSRSRRYNASQES